MLSYEVTIRLGDAALAEALERYMREQHVAEVVASGCFLDGRLERSAPAVYRTRYSCASQEDLDRYLADHARRLRADFHEHFPSGVELSREVWSEAFRV